MDQLRNEGLNEPPAHLDRLAHKVIGAALEVHRHLGPGFLEVVYEEALVVELGLQGIPVRRQVIIPISYKEHLISEARLDLIVDEELVVELKSVDALSGIHLVQVLSYLRASELQLGLLINFNVPFLKEGIRRVISRVR